MGIYLAQIAQQQIHQQLATELQNILTDLKKRGLLKQSMRFVVNTFQYVDDAWHMAHEIGIA